MLHNLQNLTNFICKNISFWVKNNAPRADEIR